MTTHLVVIVTQLNLQCDRDDKFNESCEFNVMQLAISIADDLQDQMPHRHRYTYKTELRVKAKAVAVIAKMQLVGSHYDMLAKILTYIKYV